ncbi:MAG: hypothetical protein LBB14_00160 [Puniceicoccales bacterium]|nr:hypothetical protein [Puniceicoccales bacterium]
MRKLLGISLAVVCVVALFFICGQVRYALQVSRTEADRAAVAPLPLPKATEDLHGLSNYDWQAPKGQEEADGDWTYELFTPPAIELKNGRFRAVDPAVSGLRLLRLEEVPYRLYLEGFVRKSGGTLALFVRDGGTGRLQPVEEGTFSEEGGFSVECCDFRTTSESAVREVLLRDSRDGRIRRLPLAGPRPVEEFRVEVLSDRHGRQELHRLRNFGEKMAYGGKFYEFVGGDAVAGTVRLSPAGSPLGAFHLQLSAGNASRATE